MALLRRWGGSWGWAPTSSCSAALTKRVTADVLTWWCRDSRWDNTHQQQQAKLKSNKQLMAGAGCVTLQLAASPGTRHLLRMTSSHLVQHMLEAWGALLLWRPQLSRWAAAGKLA
jgi:hypothetical protein